MPAKPARAPKLPQDDTARLLIAPIHELNAQELRQALVIARLLGERVANMHRTIGIDSQHAPDPSSQYLRYIVEPLYAAGAMLTALHDSWRALAIGRVGDVRIAAFVDGFRSVT